MANNHLSKHLAFLKYCSTASPKERRKILKAANREQLKCLCEVTLNVAKQNIKVPPAVKQKLTKHKKAIRFIVDRKPSLLRKKKELIQKGGFLPVLLKYAVPALFSAFLSR